MHTQVIHSAAFQSVPHFKLDLSVCQWQWVDGSAKQNMKSHTVTCDSVIIVLWRRRINKMVLEHNHALGQSKKWFL